MKGLLSLEFILIRIAYATLSYVEIGPTRAYVYTCVANSTAPSTISAVEYIYLAGKVSSGPTRVS